MDELTGTMVLVHPELTTDPVNRQGQMGIITGADLGKDEVYVGFGSKPLGLYSTDALLVLRPHHELYRDLLADMKQMETQDFKTLLRVSMMLENGSSKQLKEALELAMTNDRTLKYGTISLQDKLGLVLEQSQEAAQRTGIGR